MLSSITDFSTPICFAPITDILIKSAKTVIRQCTSRHQGAQRGQGSPAGEDLRHRRRTQGAKRGPGSEGPKAKGGS